MGKEFAKNESIEKLKKDDHNQYYRTQL